MNGYRVRVGRRIRRERKARGWSQNELARRTGIPEITSTQVSRWERGEAMPDETNFAALEQAFGVKLIPDDDDDELQALAA